MAIWKISVPLVVGLAIREALAPFTGHPYDFELWIRIGYYVSSGQDPYTQTSPVPNLSLPSPVSVTWIGYPPIWAFFQAGLFKMYSLTGIDNRFAYYFLIKQPMIIADLVASYLLFKIILVLGNERSAIRAATFWLICPFTIIISSVWGMFDQIILVLVLGSVLLATETSKSAMLEALGILLKVIPVIYLPVLAFSQRTKTKMIGYLAMTVGVSAFFALGPYLVFKDWNVSLLVSVGVDETTKLANSMSYWDIVTYYSNNYSLQGATYDAVKVITLIWIPAVLAATYFCIKSIRGKENFEKNLAISLLFITLVFFLTKSAINEQYLIYFLGLGLVDYFLFNVKRRKQLFHAIWIVSLVFLIANNDFLVRFLAPISNHYTDLSSTLETGLAGEMRFAIMIVCGILFTVFSLLYIQSLYIELRRIRFEEQLITKQ